MSFKLLLLLNVFSINYFSNSFLHRTYYLTKQYRFAVFLWVFSSTFFSLFSVIKHRIPSPTREAGDGMECSDKTLKSDLSDMSAQKTLKSDLSAQKKGSSSDVKRQIHLPLTNISLDKLPPITDDKVRLPEASPSSPLVKVNPFTLILLSFLTFFSSFYSEFTQILLSIYSDCVQLLLRF